MDYSTDHPEIFPENNNTKRPNTSLSVPGNELDDIENIDDIVDDKDEKIGMFLCFDLCFKNLRILYPTSKSEFVN